MNLYDSVRQAIYNSSKNLLPNNELIYSHQGGQEPKGSHCSINIIRTNKIGMEYDSTYASATDITSVSVYEVTTRFMFVGDYAGNLAYEFETVADNPASRFYFGTENLAIMRKGEIRRVPEKRDTAWIDNFVLDVIFSYAVETTQPIDIIEEVSWTPTIN
jgi:hypothetical protein